MISMGDVNLLVTGRRECDGRGSVHTFFKPDDMTVDDCLSEMVMLGHLSEVTDSTPGEWVNVGCPGGAECWCCHSDVAPGFTWTRGGARWPRPGRWSVVWRWWYSIVGLPRSSMARAVAIGRCGRWPDDSR